MDRTNTDDKLMPCKVLEVKVRNKSNVYKVYTQAGIIKTHFSGTELVSMKNVTFPALNSTDPSQLDEITVIQASRFNSKWQARSAVNSVCASKGSCVTKRCCCRKGGNKCTSKCHAGNTSVCQNIL